MILCLDIGNTNLFGGVYQNKHLLLQFRYPSTSACTSDQLGLFFKSVLSENNLSIEQIQKVMICSVVPALNYSVRSAFLKYFNISPVFLKIEHAPELIINLKNSHEIGTDRISNAIAAMQQYPQNNLIIIDMGTATTIDVISKTGQYLGGIIAPGMLISMKALHENTAMLFPVTIVKPPTILGRTTLEHIQSGLYYSHLGAIHKITQNIINTIFIEEQPVIIGTGGFAHLFATENIFTLIIPDLVLQGLSIIAKRFT